MHPHYRVPNVETPICYISQWNYLAHTCLKGQNTYDHISVLRLTFKISAHANIKKIPKKPTQSVLRFVFQGPFLWLIRRRTKAWKQNRERYSRGKVEKKCCPALLKSTQSMRWFFHKCDESNIIPTKRAGSVETSILRQHAKQAMIGCRKLCWMHYRLACC